jgi:hypothetical protein
VLAEQLRQMLDAVYALLPEQKSLEQFNVAAKK